MKFNTVHLRSFSVHLLSFLVCLCYAIRRTDPPCYHIIRERLVQMATDTGKQQLTEAQIAQLVMVIPADSWELIALYDLKIDRSAFAALNVENQGDPKAFNRAILKFWRNKNYGTAEVR